MREPSPELMLDEVDTLRGFTPNLSKGESEGSFSSTSRALTAGVEGEGPRNWGDGFGATTGRTRGEMGVRTRVGVGVTEGSYTMRGFMFCGGGHGGREDRG